MLLYFCSTCIEYFSILKAYFKFLIEYIVQIDFFIVKNIKYSTNFNC